MERVRIIAYKGGKERGYIGSVNIMHSTFSLIDCKSSAKTFTLDEAMDMIDDLAIKGLEQGYVFGIS